MSKGKFKTIIQSRVKLDDGSTYVMNYPGENYIEEKDGGIEYRPMPIVKDETNADTIYLLSEKQLKESYERSKKQEGLIRNSTTSPKTSK